jgi:cytochrome P450
MAAWSRRELEVIVSCASADRDERQFADAHAFRIDRADMQNLDFGHDRVRAPQRLARLPAAVRVRTEARDENRYCIEVRRDRHRPVQVPRRG